MPVINAPIKTIIASNPLIPAAAVIASELAADIIRHAVESDIISTDNALAVSRDGPIL